MTSALIADDEPLLREQLRTTLAALWPDLQVVAMASHGGEAVESIASLRPDMAFLDIEMPGMNGLEAAAQVKELVHVVFVTAYPQYAIEAFEHGAIDYVLKPASEARLAETVARLKRRVAAPLPAPADLQAALVQLATALGKPAGATRLKWVHASVGTQVRLIPVDDVIYFQSDLKYTRVVTAEGESLIRKPMKELLEELDPERFWQIHRGTLVNRNAILHAVREDERVYVVVRGAAQRLEVSRSFAHRFRAM